MLTEQNYVTIQKIIAKCTYESRGRYDEPNTKVNKKELVEMLSNYFELDNRRFNRRMFEIGCDS